MHTPAMEAKYKGIQRSEPGQEGITALLDGDKMFISRKASTKFVTGTAFNTGSKMKPSGNRLGSVQARKREVISRTIRDSREW